MLTRNRSFKAVLFIGCAAGLAALADPAAAVGTRRFVLDTADDFKGGDLKGVAVDDGGRVRAGFNLGSTAVTDATTIWSALAMNDGSLLLGTGNEGKLLKVDGAKVSVLAETKALAITSLATAWGGSVVLGTLPEGKVMKWERGKVVDLATLKDTEHVWQVAFDTKSNSVLAATGPEGKLYRIAQTGRAEVVFDAPEQHLMSVAVAADGTIYAGASDKAKLYKITGPGRASVLYDFGRTEVRAIAVGPKGDVYAIANEITSGSYSPSKRTQMSKDSAGPVPAPPKTKGKGTLYHFTPQGSPDQLIDDKEEHFVSLTIGDDGRPYVGTGAEGRVYTVTDAHHVVLVADTEERQVNALAVAGKQRFVAASDPAVLHPIRGVGGQDAVWTSKVFDAGLRAQFGRLTWRSTGLIELSTRTGNTKEPDETWSEWSAGMTAAGDVKSPAGRFMQVRARFNKDANAELSEVSIPFVTDNLRATLTEISTGSGSSSSSASDAVKKSGGPVEKKPEAKVELKWKVDNPDKDELRYRVQYRLVGTNTWYDLLKPNEKLTKENYSWDTSDLPEGEYRVRVVASDELSNPPDRVRRHELESAAILVDNTPPTIENLTAQARRVRGRALDGVGPIKRIEVSVAGSDEWYPFFPKDGIFDEQAEDFDADVSSFVPAGAAMLSIRVYDRANNFVVRNVALK